MKINRNELVKQLRGKLGCKLGAKYGTEWCAAFVSDELLIPLGLGKHWSCTEMRSFFTAKGKVNHDYKTAEVGDIILYDWDKSGDCDHVGIVIENRGSEIVVIEGNTCGDNYLETCVALKTYSVNYQYFSCIIDMSGYMEDGIVVGNRGEIIEQIRTKLKEIDALLEKFNSD